MNSERVRLLLRAQPFRPFVVYTNSVVDEGTSVDDPSLAKIEDEGETLIVSSPRGERPGGRG